MYHLSAEGRQSGSGRNPHLSEWNLRLADHHPRRADLELRLADLHRRSGDGNPRDPDGDPRDADGDPRDVDGNPRVGDGDRRGADGNPRGAGGDRRDETETSASTFLAFYAAVWTNWQFLRVFPRAKGLLNAAEAAAPESAPFSARKGPLCRGYGRRLEAKGLIPLAEAQKRRLEVSARAN